MSKPFMSSQSGDRAQTYWVDNGLPSPATLRQPENATKLMDDFISQEERTEKFHHEMVRMQVAQRYWYAGQLRGDPKAFAAWAQDPRIASMHRPPKKPQDALNALMHATTPDKRKASKRFKRIEHLWLSDKPVETVVAFLRKYGWEKHYPGMKPRRAYRKQQQRAASELHSRDRTEGQPISDEALNTELSKSSSYEIPAATLATGEGAHGSISGLQSPLPIKDDLIVILAEVTARHKRAFDFKVVNITLRQ